MSINLKKLRGMSANQKIVEVLSLRGFLVKLEGDFIVFDEGNGRADLFAVRRNLDELNIPTYWQRNKFQLLVENLPLSLVTKITRISGKNHPFTIKSYQKRWKYFVQREYGPKTNAIDLDPNIALLVKALNLAGILTITGCDGHRRHAPNVRFVGVFSGIWFQIIQEMYFRNLELNYRWNVAFDNRTGAYLYAEKEETASWNLRMIQGKKLGFSSQSEHYLPFY